jgi:hypothetical protein
MKVNVPLPALALHTSICNSESVMLNLVADTIIQVTGKKKCRTNHFLYKNWRTTFKKKLKIFSR